MIQQPEQTEIRLTVLDHGFRHHALSDCKDGPWSPQDALIEAIRFLRQNLKPEVYEKFRESVAKELEAARGQG